MKSFIQLFVFSFLTLNAAANAADLTIGEVPPQVVPLGTTRVIELTLTASKTWDSKKGVMLAWDRSGLGSVDPDGYVDVRVDADFFKLEPEETKKFTLTVSVNAQAPDFNRGSVRIVALGESLGGMDRIPISVPAVLEIDLKQDHDFGEPNYEDGLGLPFIKVREHRNGVLVRFVNYDPYMPHSIHGEGAIAGDSPQLSAPVNGQPGDKYEIMVSSHVWKLEGTFYCRDHENKQRARNIIFNTSY